jgi:hypothetical protein
VTFGLFRKRPAAAKCFGPKDFVRHEGWKGRGVLAKFDDLHGLDILVADTTPEHNADNFEKTWHTDADEVLFRRDKRIMLYWRK